MGAFLFMRFYAFLEQQMTTRLSYPRLDDEQIFRVCQEIVENESPAFFPKLNLESGIKSERRQLILVGSQGVKLFLENSKRDDEYINSIKNPKNTRKEFLLRKLGLFQHTNNTGGSTDLALPLGLKTAKHNADKFFAICFVMNDNNSHWSLLTYFFDDNLWRNYDSIGVAEDPRYRYNDDVCEHFMSRMFREGVIACDFEKSELLVLINVQSNFPHQSANWECGYYTILFFNFLFVKQRRIMVEDHELFDIERVKLVAKYLKQKPT